MASFFPNQHRNANSTGRIQVEEDRQEQPVQGCRLRFSKLYVNFYPHKNN